MINIILDGGFGNQLFQYSLGRNFQERGRTVTFDKTRIRDYSGAKHDKYTAQYSLAGLKTSPTFGGPVGRHVYEGSMRFKPEILDLDDATLQGCWQSDKYLGNPKTLISEFTPSAAIRDDAAAWACTIAQSKNPLFIHVRHGDYLAQENLIYHGIMPVEYYLKARKVIESKAGPTDVFVFSDDPSWCRIHLPGLVVAGNNQFEDLYLMSLCKHGVISNSSYGWWGAWLGPDKNGGVVVAPDKWFVTHTLDPADIVPERWVKL